MMMKNNHTLMVGLALVCIIYSSSYISTHAQRHHRHQQQLSSQQQCHPDFDDNKSQYIIGYGSLIDEVSKRNTDDTAGTNYPIILSGYQRSWSVYGNLPGLNTIFLTVTYNASSSFNGVIYKTINIISYDIREYIYCRLKVNETNLILLNDTSNILDINRQIWIYISKRSHDSNESKSGTTTTTPSSPTTTTTTSTTIPSRRFPIVQSYVDIFIRGCLNISKTYKYFDDSYAKMCISSTSYWPIRRGEWINDRIFPRRPLIYEPMAREVDQLLFTMISNSFNIISFERSDYNNNNKEEE
jgi:cation transport regulator ChaC